MMQTFIFTKTFLFVKEQGINMEINGNLFYWIHKSLFKAIKGRSSDENEELVKNGLRLILCYNVIYFVTGLEIDCKICRWVAVLVQNGS